MKKNFWIPVLLGLLVTGILLHLYIRSDSFSGAVFSDESQGHVGLYLEHNGILSSDNEAVSIDGSTATILKAGTYDLSGQLTDGQIIIDADPTAEITLKLSDVSLSCSYSSPLWVKCADKVKIKLPEDTNSFISDGAFYTAPDDDTPNACITAKSDLTIRGKGHLTVTANYRNGISCSDDLRIKSGILTVTAPHHALRGNDGVYITDGVVTLTAGANAIESNDCILVDGGILSLTAKQHLLHAVHDITVTDNASFKLLDGASNAGCNGTLTLSDSFTTFTQESLFP